MNKRYGTTQVCEFTFSQSEVEAMIAENVAARCDPSYDFDTSKPVVIRRMDPNHPNSPPAYVVRFFQRAITQDGSADEHFRIKPLKKD